MTNSDQMGFTEVLDHIMRATNCTRRQAKAKLDQAIRKGEFPVFDKSMTEISYEEYRQRTEDFPIDGPN